MRQSLYWPSVQHAERVNRRRLRIRVFGIFIITSLICLMLTVQTRAAGPAFIVKVLNMSPNGGIGYLASIGREIYFSAWDSDTGVELWKSDGTPEGTAIVKDVNPGTASSNPFFLTNFGGILLFSAADDLHGRALWKSDGTPEGTVIVKEVEFADIHAVVVDGTMFFVDGDQLWKSDGTPEGTVMIINTPGKSLGGLRSVNSTVFFSSDLDLWRTDGTTEGTQLVKHFESGGPYQLTAVNGTLFFATTNRIDDIVIGYRLWKSDGTPEGTAPLKEFAAQPYFHGIDEFLNVNGSLLFLKKSYVSPNEMEVWRSDGTSVGTTLVKTVCVEAGTPYYAQNTEVNGTLFFSCGEAGASLSSGYELWKSDRTAAGTQLVKTFNPDALESVLWLADVNGTLCFTADEGIYGMEPWQSDGTAGGTQLIQDIAPGPASSYPRGFTATETHVFFIADDGSNGGALWAMPLSALLPPVSPPTSPPIPTATVTVPTSTPVTTPNTPARVYLSTVSNGD